MSDLPPTLSSRSDSLAAISRHRKRLTRFVSAAAIVGHQGGNVEARRRGVLHRPERPSDYATHHPSNRRNPVKCIYVHIALAEIQDWSSRIRCDRAVTSSALRKLIGLSTVLLRQWAPSKTLIKRFNHE